MTGKAKHHNRSGDKAASPPCTTTTTTTTTGILFQQRVTGLWLWGLPAAGNPLVPSAQRITQQSLPSIIPVLVRTWHLPDTAQKGLGWEGEGREYRENSLNLYSLWKQDKNPLQTTEEVLSLFSPVPPVSQHLSETLLPTVPKPCPPSLRTIHLPQRLSQSPYLHPRFSLISVVKSHRSRVLKTSSIFREGK